VSNVNPVEDLWTITNSYNVGENNTLHNKLDNLCENMSVNDKVKNTEYHQNLLELNISNEARNSNDINISSTFTKETDDITENDVHFNTYNVNDNISSRTNKIYVTDNTLLNPALAIFTPLAESTFADKLITKCSTDTHDIESDNSISEDNMDDSFHLSDCSTSGDTDENESDENENDENATNINVNETMKSTLNVTSSLCKSKKDICNDKDMYVETSHESKLKLVMCLYCKKLQTQFARHLESVHKSEEDVKKFRFLPKGK